MNTTNKPRIKPLGMVAGGIAVLFVLIQLVPVARTNPPITQAIPWDSVQTQQLAERACMDCHSNETKWLWYAYIAPASWLVTRDTIEGRSKLNFSEWDKVAADKKAKLAQKVEEEITRGSMPDPKYLPIHPTARLSSTEKQQLIDGLKASILK